MKCRYCGHDIPDGILYCEQCGREVQIVPDYNPLDDVLAAQIRGSIDGTDSPLDDYEYKTSSMNRQRDTQGRRNTGSGRNTAYGRNTGSGRNTNPGRNTSARRNTNAGRRTGTGKTSQSTGDMRDREQRRRQAERRKALKRKKRKRALIMLGVAVVLIGVLSFVLYQNSYAGQINKGNKAVQESDYNLAESYYKKAVKKKPKRAEAYSALAKVYTAQNEQDEAEDIFLTAIDKYPDNVDIHKACIQFYIDTKQETEISVLMDEASDTVRKQLKEYISKVPEFSLESEEPFDDVQQLTLTSKGEAIYYTTDGSEPTTGSTKYTEPIQIGEGETKVSAISVNKKGIPSLVESKTYIVELPIEDAPAVTPSTGQYDTPTQITIDVPEGYEAYYTTDKSDPTTESTKYTGPIDMPQGTTILKAVLVNGKGRMSGVTTRNYELN